jgi:immune inhibitor A
MKSDARSIVQPFLVAPSPTVLKALHDEFAMLMLDASPSLRSHVRLGESRRNKPGYSDGLIYPPNEAPDRTLSLSPAMAAAPAAPAGPGPVRGVVRIIVLLAQFQDKAFTADAAHFDKLLFSDGIYPTGSLRDYYSQASYGKVLIAGEIHGPYTLPQAYAYYTGGDSGVGDYPHNAQRMAEDAVALADADVSFAPFDPNGDSYVDALLIVHAGPGAEAVASAADRTNHIWSHKWVLSQRLTLDAVHLYAYLTVPEDGRLGVFAHELGHLLFQWPDLYDTDYSSAGLGNWCIMAGGSWNNGGDTPALPCAWCKLAQGWADVGVAAGKQSIALPRAMDHQRVWKLGNNTLPAPEYFLLENRQRHGFDTYLPGGGLMIYHIDESRAANANEPNYKVGLVQADGERDLEENISGGDDGDPYPGSTDNRVFDGASKPASQAYSGQLTGISVRDISDAGLIMTCNVDVAGRATTPVPGGPLPPTPPAALPRRSVMEVTGIGRVRAAKLEALGIRGLADLALASPAALATSLGVAAGTAGEYIAAARLLLNR